MIGQNSDLSVAYIASGHAKARGDPGLKNDFSSSLDIL